MTVEIVGPVELFLEVAEWHGTQPMHQFFTGHFVEVGHTENPRLCGVKCRRVRHQFVRKQRVNQLLQR